MYGLFETDEVGVMSWCGNAPTLEEAEKWFDERIDKVPSECCLMIMPISSFYQNLKEE